MTPTILFLATHATIVAVAMRTGQFLLILGLPFVLIGKHSISIAMWAIINKNSSMPMVSVITATRWL